MIGIALIAMAEFFSEASVSIGRYEVKKRRETLYTMGFLSAFWATVFLCMYSVLWGEFRFSAASLPTFGLRLVLEIVLVFVTLHATIAADRSTFTFLRTITIPLLLVADIALGYSLSSSEIIGVSLIALSLILLLFNHGLSRRGKVLSLLSGLTAVATLTLYKYDITHFNSVEAEQALTHGVVLVVIAIAAKWRTGENVARHLFRPIFFAQSLLAGIAAVFFSFAYLFAPASVITAAKRVLEIGAAILAGSTFFHEKHLVVKISALLMVMIGMLLITF